MKDPIERQAAIDAISRCMDIYINNLQTMIYKADAYKALADLPSAQPETCEGCKHSGKWKNEVECGYLSPCTLCKRRVADNYER